MPRRKQTQLEKDIAAKRIHWQTHPLEFVKDVIRVEKINSDNIITEQQRQYLLALGQFVISKRKQYEVNQGRAPEDAGYQPQTEVQKVIGRMAGISVMAGRGVGKSASLAWTILWFLCCFDDAIVVCTSGKVQQIKEVIWAAVSKWRNARVPDGSYAFLMREIIKVTGEQIKFDSKDVTRFAKMGTFQRSANTEDLKATLSGDHSDNMLILCDEASSIPEPVFEPLEDTMTGKMNFAVLTFNPNKNSGYAYDSHYGPHKSKWHRLRWNAEESELVSASKIEDYREQYGVESDRYRVSVLGLPPLGGEDVLIPYEWVAEANEREKPVDETAGRVLGVDPARHGSDKTVFVLRQGSNILDVREYSKLATDEVADLVIEYGYDNDIDAVFIDCNGIGWGVFDQVKRCKDFKTCAVEVSKKARDPHRFMRRRDELWWKCRVWFEKDRPSIPENRDLIDQLTDIHYSDEDGKIKIERKSQMKKRTGKSPDVADALNLTFDLDDRRFSQERPDKDSWDESWDARRPDARSWMTG